MSFSISPGGSFASLNVTSCVRTLNAGGKDTCEIVLAKEAADAAGWAEDDEVTVSGPGGNFFMGVVDRPGRSATGSGQYHTLTLVSKWKWLEEIPFTQQWASGSTGSAGRKSRVALGISSTGDRQDTASIILDVLDHANANGAGIEGGSILSGGGMEVPVMEMTDSTCAEVIRSVLRWHPDAVLYFDHTTGQLNIVRPDSMATISRVAGPEGGATKIESAPCSAMTLRGVAIHYEVANTVDGVTYNQIVTETAGATTGRRVAHFTVPLQGATIVNQSQKIKTADFIMSKDDPDLGAWMIANIPELAAVSPGPGQLIALDPEQVIDEDAAVGPGTIPDVYPRYIVSGQVHDWMIGVSAAPVEWRIKLKFVGSASDNPDLAKLFRRSEKIETFRAFLMGTDAQDQVYSHTNATPAEEVPEGLAAAYLAAFSSAVPSGVFSNVLTDPDTGIVPGKKLSVSGALTLTGAPVQSSTVDVFTGRCSGRFGPMNAALGAGDMIEIQRAGQRSRPLQNYALTARSDSQVGESQTVKGALAGRAKSTSKSDGVPTDDYFYCWPGGTGSVQISAGLVLTQQWPGSISTETPEPSQILRQLTVSGATVTAGAGSKIYLKATFEKKEYEPEGDLTGSETHSITGGKGGSGGSGGNGGRGGRGGSGGSGGSGGAGGSGGKGGDGGKGGIAIYIPYGGATASQEYAEGNPGDIGAPGDSGFGGTAGAAGATGAAAPDFFETDGPMTGGTGGTGADPSVATFDSFTKAKLKVAVWEVTSCEFHVATSTPSGSPTVAYALIAEVEEGSDEEVIIKQRHRGILSLPGTVSVTVPSAS